MRDFCCTLCYCMRDWGGLRCPWDFQDFGHERNYAVQYWLFQSSFSKTGMYPITCVSSVRKGGGLWEGGVSRGGAAWLRLCQQTVITTGRRWCAVPGVSKTISMPVPWGNPKIAWFGQILLRNNHWNDAEFFSSVNVMFRTTIVK